MLVTAKTTEAGGLSTLRKLFRRTTEAAGGGAPPENWKLVKFQSEICEWKIPNQHRISHFGALATERHDEEFSEGK